jgi:hypothetical protein
VCYSTKLVKLQLDAARIVTGLPIFTKTDKLYSETGWTTLSSRRLKDSVVIESLQKGINKSEPFLKG